eukprot:scaffold748_cov251-Pinguiococcus_pyrenoidosus.AAC.45
MPRWNEGVVLRAVRIPSILRQRLQPVRDREEVRHRHDEGQRRRLANVEVKNGRKALWRNPERLSVRGDVVPRELMDQILHPMHVEAAVQVRGEPDAACERVPLDGGRVLGQSEQARAFLVGDVHDGLGQIVCVQHVGLRFHLQAADEAVRILEEVAEAGDGRDEQIFELPARPLDAVDDGAGEVSERAHRDGLPSDGLGVSFIVALGLSRQDHHGVELGALRPRLQEGLLEEDALRVHVLPRLDTVQRIGDEAQAASGALPDVAVFVGDARADPEVIVEHVLRRRHGKQLQGLDVDAWVHHFHAAGGGGGLGRAHVLGTEKELAVEVADLDAVSVRDGDEAVWSARDTQQRKVLQELAAEGPATHHEGPGVLHLLLQLVAEERDVVRIATGRRRARRRRGLRQDLDAVKVEPLIERRELPRELDNLLCHDAADEAG